MIFFKVLYVRARTHIQVVLACTNTHIYSFENMSVINNWSEKLEEKTSSRMETSIFERESHLINTIDFSWEA